MWCTAVVGDAVVPLSSRMPQVGIMALVPCRLGIGAVDLIL